MVDFDELGIDLKELNKSGQEISDFDSHSHTLVPGPVPIMHEIYYAIRDFNPEDKEKSQDDKGFKILAYRTGELILMTIKPNRGGWFEGYRFNDPERLCGLGHMSTLKKINFN